MSINSSITIYTNRLRANTHSQKKYGVHQEDGGLDPQTGVVIPLSLLPVLD
jgi:hypothetical protein